ncbi:jasmonate-induced oxygenase 2-like [Andrographis paniculata]|uniref:jasmonate-induced oxygenase 2-like n=1 Tax=Andrographis paniculata TaxID=175694 RepID=UPI0021E6F511|nr:jasmonate-induced oxygenase 2-like [Andrographis paniculata]
MASSSAVTAATIEVEVSGERRKHVQEMSEDGDEVPQGYVWKDKSRHGPIELVVPLAEDFPVIDLSRLLSPSTAIDAAAELASLRSALRSWGCFKAINHGIDISLLENLRQFSREFFHLPMAEKQKYARGAAGNDGYGTDPMLFKNQPLDWTDRLFLTVTPRSHQNLQYWPENLRDILNEYADKVGKIQVELLKAMARSSNLPEDRFLKQYGEQPYMVARFNFYPPCKRPDLVLGLKPHSDGSALTFLLQDDEVKGLQLLKDDNWFEIPTMPHALLVNVGDQLEIMSNGEFKSPVHKVIINSERERNTLALFCSPDVSMEIGPVEELVDGARPRLFKNIQNYIPTYFHYFQQGEMPIDAMRI